MAVRPVSPAPRRCAASAGRRPGPCTGGCVARCGRRGSAAELAAAACRGCCRPGRSAPCRPSGSAGRSSPTMRAAPSRLALKPAGRWSVAPASPLARRAITRWRAPPAIFSGGIDRSAIRACSACTSATSLSATGAKPSVVPRGEQPVLQAVEAGEARILLLLLEIVGAGVERRVEIGEQVGDRLDPLVMDPGRRPAGRAISPGRRP